MQIFWPGRHVASSGQTLTFGADEVAGAAASYDPLLHEAPAVVGYPEHDRPAYGWVKGLKVEGGALVAELDQVGPDFGELVRAGRFKKISAAFYRPDAPSNPKPGSWYLRHVGFLGAQPPAVKELKPVQFVAAEPDIVEFAAGGGAGAADGYGAGLPDRIDSTDAAALAAAAGRYQAAQADLGRAITVAAAVGVVRMRDPQHVARLAVAYAEAHEAGPASARITLDPANLLRDAAAVGLNRQQLVREGRREQASWALFGVKRTLFEACWMVINDRRQQKRNRPMTPAELKAASF